MTLLQNHYKESLLKFFFSEFKLDDEKFQIAEQMFIVTRASFQHKSYLCRYGRSPHCRYKSVMRLIFKMRILIIQRRHPHIEMVLWRNIFWQQSLQLNSQMMFFIMYVFTSSVWFHDSLISTFHILVWQHYHIKSVSFALTRSGRVMQKMPQETMSSLVQVMACYLFETKP